jgi:hypothetical protein
MVGMTNGGPPDPALITYNNRQHCWTLHFAVDSLTIPQVVLIDSTLDPVNGSLLFGLFGGVISFTPDFTSGAIFYGVTSEASGENRVLPDEFSLHQNYPNPFNASTNIEFTLPEAAHVDLSVYNILGQKVAVISKGLISPGQYSVVWDAGDEPSGVYFVRLDGDDFSKSLKMVLLK